MTASHLPPRLIYVLLLLLLAAGAAQAAVPNKSAVPAYAEEQTILQAEKGVPEPGFTDKASGRRHFDRHYIVSPGLMAEQDLILQRGGNTWRTLRNGPFAAIAGTLVLVVPILIFGLYRLVGPSRLEQLETGRRILRYPAWDRVIHWSTAISFVTLALTGLIILFGKKVLLPWMGHDIFSWVAVVSKYVHNFVGPLFILCVVSMFYTFLSRSLFDRWDWVWVRKGGGILSHEHVPAGFLNAGQKTWFWFAVVFLGLVMTVSGLMLDFPYFIGIDMASTRYMLQLANYTHLIGATLFIIGTMGHAYLGTLGVPGAYEGMRYGTVDEEWARTHHELWYEDVRGEGGEPMEAPPRRVPPGTSPYAGS